MTDTKPTAPCDCMRLLEGMFLAELEGLADARVQEPAAITALECVYNAVKNARAALAPAAPTAQGSLDDFPDIHPKPSQPAPSTADTREGLSDADVAALRGYDGVLTRDIRHKIADHISRLEARVAEQESELDAVREQSSYRLSRWTGAAKENNEIRDQLRAAEARVAEQAKEINELGRQLALEAKESRLATHKVITCGVAASHPDANLSRTGAHAGAWDSPQAQKVRELRDERDALLQQLASAQAEAAQGKAWRECVQLRMHSGDVWLHCKTPSGSRYGSINLGHGQSPIVQRTIEELATLPAEVPK